MERIPDFAWEKIKKLSVKKNNMGRPSSNPKIILSGILYALEADCQ